MPQSAVEDAVKVLTEFEDQLSKIKQESDEAKKRFSTIAAEGVEKARTDVLARAQSAAESVVARAKRDAENEARASSKKGQESLDSLNARISKKSEEATAAVVKHLLED